MTGKWGWLVLRGLAGKRGVDSGLRRNDELGGWAPAFAGDSGGGAGGRWAAGDSGGGAGDRKGAGDSGGGAGVTVGGGGC